MRPELLAKIKEYGLCSTKQRILYYLKNRLSISRFYTEVLKELKERNIDPESTYVYAGLDYNNRPEVQVCIDVELTDAEAEREIERWESYKKMNEAQEKQRLEYLKKKYE